MNSIITKKFTFVLFLTFMLVMTIHANVLFLFLLASIIISIYD